MIAIPELDLTSPKQLYKYKDYFFSYVLWCISLQRQLDQVVYILKYIFLSFLFSKTVCKCTLIPLCNLIIILTSFQDIVSEI